MIKRYYDSVGGKTNNYTLVYTNNNQSVPIELKKGSTVIYSGFYSADPLSGHSDDLPASSSLIILQVTGKTIMFATCNGVNASISSGVATWPSVTGNLLIQFQTN